MSHRDDSPEPMSERRASATGPTSARLVHELADLMMIIDNYATLIAGHAADTDHDALEFDAGALREAVHEAQALIGRLRATPDREPRLSQTVESYLMPDEPDGADAPPSSRTIVVVEDDPTVRNLVARMLGRLGYIVETLDDIEAVSRRCAEPDVALLLCDVVMPGASGFELVERVRSVNTGLPALLMSGHFDGPVTADDEHDAIGLLPKPFDLKTLKTAIEQALASANPPLGSAIDG